MPRAKYRCKDCNESKTMWFAMKLAKVAFANVACPMCGEAMEFVEWIQG